MGNFSRIPATVSNPRYSPQVSCLIAGLVVVLAAAAGSIFASSGVAPAFATDAFFVLLGGIRGKGSQLWRVL